MHTGTTVGLVLTATLVAVPFAWAQETRSPIKIMVGYPAGSASDAAARALADRLKDGLGRIVIVENRPGASGRLAADAVKRSPGDGTTLLLAPMGTTIILPIVAKLSYDPWKDFVHVSQVATLRLAFAVGPGTPARTLKDYVAWARSHPGGANFGSAGAGTPPHFLGAMIGRATGAELNHIAYKGGPPLVTDLVGGHIPAGAGTPTDFGELHRSGKLRVLALGGSHRYGPLPDVPTFRELGYDIDGTSWLGVHAPAATPKVTVDRFAAQIMAALRESDMRERLSNVGLEATGTSAAQFLQILEQDKARWEPVVRASGFRED